MDISENGLRLIEEFEGYSFHAYWDQWGRVWTVGFGETENVGPGTTMTRAQAEEDLKNRIIREYEPAIKHLGVDLNQNQFDALCSFVWNLGPGSMQWNVGHFIQAHNFQAAANAMLEYDRAGGVVLAGLARRRQQERALFLRPAKPPPPPDPHHYNWYPAQNLEFQRTRDHSRFTLNERGVVQYYDHLWANHRRDTKQIEISRAHITILRQRIHTVANLPPKPPHWNDSRRFRWRSDRLGERLHGAVKL
jgi:GH24 family phage-related lysozyme (muramidase)